MDTQAISSRLAPRFPIMSGRATFTIELSITCMSAASTTANAMMYLCSAPRCTGRSTRVRIAVGSSSAGSSRTAVASDMALRRAAWRVHAARIVARHRRAQRLEHARADSQVRIADIGQQMRAHLVEQRPQPARQCAAAGGQMQRARALVGRIGLSRHETERFELRERADERWPLDIEAVGELALANAIVVLDDHERRGLCDGEPEAAEFTIHDAAHALANGAERGEKGVFQGGASGGAAVRHGGLI